MGCMVAGELSKRDYKSMMDSFAKRRLQSQLDIMQRMGLVSVVKDTVARPDGLPVVYAVESEAWFEEPDSLSTEHVSVTFAARQSLFSCLETQHTEPHPSNPPNSLLQSVAWLTCQMCFQQA